MKSDYFLVSPGNNNNNGDNSTGIVLQLVGHFPTEDGLIAPGIRCSFIITFTPDSLANYRESMKVNINTMYVRTVVKGMLIGYV